MTSCRPEREQPRTPLRVRVNDELTLDAGCWVEETGPHGVVRVVLPPDTTMFHQVLANLEAKPDPSKLPSGSTVGREGVAAAATLRSPHGGAPTLPCCSIGISRFYRTSTRRA